MIIKINPVKLIIYCARTTRIVVFIYYYIIGTLKPLKGGPSRVSIFCPLFTGCMVCPGYQKAVLYSKVFVFSKRPYSVSFTVFV